MTGIDRDAEPVPPYILTDDAQRIWLAGWHAHRAHLTATDRPTDTGLREAEAVLYQRALQGCSGTSMRQQIEDAHALLRAALDPGPDHDQADGEVWSDPDHEPYSQGWRPTDAALRDVRAAGAAVIAAWDDAAPAEPCGRCQEGAFVALWQFDDDERVGDAVDALRRALDGITEGSQR